MEAMKVLEFQGYIAPGVLLVSGSPCALEVIRAAWARNVLRPPNNYVITIVGKSVFKFFLYLIYLISRRKLKKIIISINFFYLTVFTMMYVHVNIKR